MKAKKNPKNRTEDFIILDFETTGLSPYQDEVVEMAAVRINGGKIVDQFEMLVAPTVAVSPKAFEAHGLSDSFLKTNGKKPKDAWTALGGFISDLPLVAHNGLAFDFPFLLNALSQHGLTPAANSLLDSLPLAKSRLKTKSGKYSLEALAESYKFIQENAHRAMPDVMVLNQVFKLIQRQESDLTALWNESGGYALNRLNEMPAGFDLLAQAIEGGLELELTYEGADKPRRNRWIKPYGIMLGNHGTRILKCFCLEEKTEKTFLLSRIHELLRTR